MNPLLGQEYQPLKASNEDVGASLSHYYEAIANFEEPGKKKEASTALTKLLELLERPESDAAARMRANGAAAADGQGPSSGASGPTFTKMVFRVERMLCKNETTAKKDQVDKLKRLLLLSERRLGPRVLRRPRHSRVDTQRHLLPEPLVLVPLELLRRGPLERGLVFVVDLHLRPHLHPAS